MVEQFRVERWTPLDFASKNQFARVVRFPLFVVMQGEDEIVRFKTKKFATGMRDYLEAIDYDGIGDVVAYYARHLVEIGKFDDAERLAEY